MQKLQDELENKIFNPSQTINMHITFFLPILLALFSLTSCDFKKAPPKCDVLVSIPPYLYFVNQLTNGELKAESLVPEGANPHLYEPSPKQVAEAKRAKVWIRLNESFEQKILRSLQEQNAKLIIVNLAEALTLPSLPSEHGSCKHCHHHHKDSLDLHFWLSLRLAKDQAKFIAKALCEAFPERTQQIENNLSLLEKKFEETDLLITQELLPFEGQAILVSHPAFGYFCYDYKLKQISIEQEGKDPLPKEISAILQSAKSSSIRTVLTQAQYNNKGALIIAEKLNLPVHEVDPYSENYLDNLLYIAHCVDKP